jgi:hypothetical protein
LIENDTDCAPVKSSEKSELTGQRKGNTRPRVTRKAKSLNLGFIFDFHKRILVITHVVVNQVTSPNPPRLPAPVRFRFF